MGAWIEMKTTNSPLAPKDARIQNLEIPEVRPRDLVLSKIQKGNNMLTLTFFNDDVLTIPESAIANFKALGITNSLRFKNEHWIKDSTAQAVTLDLYVEQLKQLKTAVNSVDPTSNKTALDNLLSGDYQITSFERDNDLQTYVVWKSTETTKVSIKTKLLQLRKHQMAKFFELSL